MIYHAIVVEADTKEHAREKADMLSVEGAIEFDYFNDTDILDEYVLSVQML